MEDEEIKRGKKQRAWSSKGAEGKRKKKQGKRGKGSSLRGAPMKELVKMKPERETENRGEALFIKQRKQRIQRRRGTLVKHDPAPSSIGFPPSIHVYTTLATSSNYMVLLLWQIIAAETWRHECRHSNFLVYPRHNPRSNSSESGESDIFDGCMMIKWGLQTCRRTTNPRGNHS